MTTQTHATIARFRDDGIAVTTLEHGGIRELFITGTPDGRTSLRDMFERTCRVVRDSGAVILRQDVFGVTSERDVGPAALRETCGAVDWPVSWLEEGASQAEALTGTHVQAVAGAPVRRVVDEGVVIGTVFDNTVGTYCRLAGVGPSDSRQPREVQARLVFERIERALMQADMTFENVIRTWFYVDRILEWYGGFNAARSRFFEERRVFGRMLPASTGVGGANHAGGALLADVLAVKRRQGGFPLTVREVQSPLQCPAMKYRSSFSRAVEMDCGDHRRLFISGTASIDGTGATVRVGDVRGQMELTVDVVEAILGSRRMGWVDVTRAIVYVKDGNDAGLWRRYAAERGLEQMPAVVVENDICRDDLLFELEVDAIAIRGVLEALVQSVAWGGEGCDRSTLAATVRGGG